MRFPPFVFVLATMTLLLIPATSFAQSEADLKKTADVAVAKKDVAEKALQAARQTLQQKTAAFAKLKSELAQAPNKQKAAEANLKKQQDAATKATAAATAAEPVRVAAAKAATDAKGKPDEKAKADAAKKAADALAKAKTAAAAAALALKQTQETIAGSKKIVAGHPALVKTAETELAAITTNTEKAQTTFETDLADAVAKQRTHEGVLIKAGKLVSFSEKIAPIFAQRCLACHNARTAKGRFNMESFSGIMKGGESGSVVELGDADGSTLFSMIEDGSMPEDADPLSKEQIALVKQWINTGAKLNAGFTTRDKLIAIMPKAAHPKSPEAYRVPVPVTALTFNPTGTQLLTSGYHEVIVWNPADGSQVKRITNVAERVYDIEFSPDGKLFAVAAGTPSQIGEVKLFETATGKEVADLVRSEDSIFSVAFSADGTRIACGGADRAIRVYSVATGKQQTLIEDHADWVMGIAFSPDGTKIASASRDKTSKVFDAKTGESLVTYNGHGNPVFGVGFTPNNLQVITAGADKQIRIWNVKDAKQVRAIGGFGSNVFRIQVTKDGQIFSSSADKTARQHNSADGKAIRSFTGHTDWVYSVSYDPTTKKVAAGGYDGEVRIWNVADGKELVTFTAAPGYKKPDAAASASK
jgi:WD40 repeat protein